MTLNRFPANYFEKYDETDDRLFYVDPRKVVHIDDGAIRALTEQFATLLPANAVILDLMSSWRSHLPTSITPKRVVGQGMNAEEMRDNPQLDKYIVHDLNADQRLPFEENSFDAAVCTVSVQYLTRPVEVFAEIARVLKPNAPFVVSFSNRCFPTKAVAVWTSTNDSQHLALVTAYFEAAGGWKDITTWQGAGKRGVFGSGDPLYIVWARKEGETT